MRKLLQLNIDKYILALIAIVIAILPTLIVLGTGAQLQMNDDMFQEFFSHGFWRKTIIEQGKFPLWCPYANGGYPLYAHPHDASTVLPLLPAVLLLGEEQGIKLNVLLIWLIGLWGLRRLLLDEIKLQRRAPWPLVMLYAASPFFWGTLVSGNYNETLIFMLPAILACQFKAQRRPLWLLAAALMLAALLAFGKFTAISAGAVCTAYGLRLALQRGDQGNRSPKIGLAQLGLLAALSLGLAALKLLPMLDLLGRARLGQPYNYGPWFRLSFRGLVVGYLAILALLLRLRSRSWFWPGMLSASMLLTAGAGLPFNLGRLLAHLPLLDKSFHDTGQYWYIPAWTLFCISLARPLVVGAPARSRSSGLFYLALFSASFSLLILVRSVLIEFHEKPRIQPGEFHQVIGRDMPRNGLRTERSNEYYNLLRNVGTIDWYSDQIDLPSAVRPRFFVIAPPDADLEHPDNSIPRPYNNDTLEPNPDYRGEAWIEPAAAGRVLSFELGVNRVIVTAKLNAPAVIVVNQNFDPYWTLERRPAAESNGLLASEPLGPGFHKLTWEYRPRPWRQGLLLSALSLVFGALLLAVWQRRIRCRERSS